MAAHYGVSKAQLLDASAADLPLRMALGEAQVCPAGVWDACLLCPQRCRGVSQACSVFSVRGLWLGVCGPARELGKLIAADCWVVVQV